MCKLQEMRRFQQRQDEKQSKRASKLVTKLN